MDSPHPLSALTDPISLGKVQVLLVPVHLQTSPVPSHIYESYLSIIKKHQTLRGDELFRPYVPDGSRTHSPAPAAKFCGRDSNPRLRFFPQSTGTSISVSRGASAHHVHLSYISSTPARHAYPLSLLRLAGFPLIVLGIAVENKDAPNGYSLDENGEAEGVDATTPVALTFHDKDTPVKNVIPPEQSFENTISELFSESSPFPIVKRLLVVPDRQPDNPSPPNKSANTQTFGSGGITGRDRGEVKFAPEDGVENWVTSLLGEVVGDLLGELGVIATALETPAGLKTLSSTLLPSLTATIPSDNYQSFTQSRTNSLSDDQHRSSLSTPAIASQASNNTEVLITSMGISLTRSLTPGGRATSVQAPSQPPIQTTSISPAAPQPIPPASSNPFRRSTAISSPFSRTSSSASTSSQVSASSSPATVSGVASYTSADLSGVAGGRLLKLLGDFYLLAGMYGEAIKCYDEGAEKCRAVGDVLWEGVAREGRAVAGVGEAWEGRDGSNMTQPFPTSPIPVEILSHYLSALACISRAPLPYSPTVMSPSPQAASGSLNLPSPNSLDPSNPGTGEGLLALLHTGLSLRISHFMLLIWASGGWGSIALSSVMSHVLPRSFAAPLTQAHKITPAAKRRHNRELAILSSQSQITRSSIFDHAGPSIGPHHRAMTKVEQLSVHNEVIWLSRWLGLERKEATVTREVLKRLAGIVVERRQEASSMITEASPRSSSGLAGNGEASVGLGLGIPVTVKAQTVAIRRKESIDGNAGVVALFERAAGIMGIDLLSASSSLSRYTIVNLSSKDDPDLEGFSFGWPELQIEMMKEGIAVMESLPDHASLVRLCLSALNGLQKHLNSQSQGILAKLYPPALATIRRRGLEFGGAPWWVPGNIVISLEIASLSPNKMPLRHSQEELVRETYKKDLFLYNPRTKTSEGDKTILVANEQVDVFVTLRNPFAFNLDIHDLSVITTGVPLQTTFVPLTIPALSVHTIRLSGIAPSPGPMEVRCVSIRLADGSSTDVLLPILSSTERQRCEKRKSRTRIESQKTKATGSDARSAATRTSAAVGAYEIEGTEKWLECTVVEELPLAWIKSSSVTHGVVMLYNGESTTIYITVENSSAIAINFLKLSFDDSTAHEAQAIIAEGKLTPEQAYELDWDQQKRPVFVWENEQELGGEVLILPGGRTTLAIRCLGKVGCTDGLIRIDYGSVNLRPSHNENQSADATNPPRTFFTRRITFPLLFTVYHTIDCHSLDLTYIGGYLNKIKPTPAFDDIGKSIDSALVAALEDETEEKYHLFGINFRNIFGVPFNVTLSRVSDAHVTGAECTRLLPPGATERMTILLPRRSLPSEAVSRPVPSLSERQYIVDKEEKSKENITMTRERFWYREALLGMLSASWSEPGSLRHGSLSLRDQHFPTNLLQIIKSDAIEVRIKVISRNTETTEIKTVEFVDLLVEVVNSLDRTFRPHLHLESLPSTPSDSSWSKPSSLYRPITAGHDSHPHKNVLFDGLSDVALPPMAEGEKTVFSVGTTFLAAGEYGFRAAVEEIDHVEGAVDSDIGSTEKKMWFSPVVRVSVFESF